MSKMSHEDLIDFLGSTGSTSKKTSSDSLEHSCGSVSGSGSGEVHRAALALKVGEKRRGVEWSRVDGK